ncbi:MAG TPA: hypothetical protein VIP28_13135 [Nocardioides sp.]
MAAPASASRHYRRIQRLAGITVAAARRSWRKMDPARSWEQQYQEEGGIGAELALLAGAAQVAAATESDSYMADILNELAFGPPTQRGVINIPGFVGVMGDGRPVETLLKQTVVTAGESFNEARAAAPVQARSIDLDRASVDALEEAERFLDKIMHEVVAETARAAESAAMVQREWVEGWVRMVNPPACSRCIILAGRFYLWNEGFDRHVNCDCDHIPASEAIAGDLTLDPDAYFESLSPEEQDQRFGKAGAQALRDGADMAQVVNARRGMQKAQVFGRDALITTEGTTRRGRANQALNTRRRNTGGTRTGGAAPIRLMPESIYDQAKDRGDAIRLLKLHGFIT